MKQSTNIEHGRLKALAKRAALYGVFGGSGVMLDMGIYSIMIFNGFNYQLANIVGYVSGTILSFILNRSLNYRVKDQALKRFIMFLAVALLGLTVSVILLWVLVEIIGLGSYLAKIIALIFVAGFQFTLNTVITFRQSTPIE